MKVDNTKSSTEIIQAIFLGECWDGAYLTTFPSSASNGSNITCGESVKMSDILY